MKHNYQPQYQLTLFVFLIFTSFKCVKEESYIIYRNAIVTSNSDNVNAFPILMGLNDSISPLAFGIQIHPLDSITLAEGSPFGDKLTSINIYSLYDFNASHPAGTSLNEYFFWMPESSYIGKYEVNNLTVDKNIRAENRYLLLSKKPSLSQIQQFVVVVEKEGLKQMSDTCELVKFY